MVLTFLEELRPLTLVHIMRFSLVCSLVWELPCMWVDVTVYWCAEVKWVSSCIRFYLIVKDKVSCQIVRMYTCAHPTPGTGIIHVCTNLAFTRVLET